MKLLTNKPKTLTDWLGVIVCAPVVVALLIVVFPVRLVVRGMTLWFGEMDRGGI